MWLDMLYLCGILPSIATIRIPDMAFTSTKSCEIVSPRLINCVRIPMDNLHTREAHVCATYASTWTTVSTAGSVISPLTNELKPKQPKEKLSIHMDEFMCLLAFRRHAQWPLVGSRFAQKKKEREAEASSSGILTFYLFEQSYAKMFDEVFSPSKWHQIITRDIAKCDILSACIPELFAFACNANLLNQFITWYDLQVKASTISRLGIILNRFGKLKPYCYCVTTAAYNEYE